MATIENLRRQTEQNIEIILIEDAYSAGLCDNSGYAANVKGIDRYIYLRNHFGYCRSKVANTGLKEAKSQYMVMHDADVLVPPDYTSRLLKHLNAGSKILHIGLISGQLLWWETDDLFEADDKYQYGLNMLKVRPPRKKAYKDPFTSYSIAMNVEAAKDIGGFYTKLLVGDTKTQVL